MAGCYSARETPFWLSCTADPPPCKSFKIFWSKNKIAHENTHNSLIFKKKLKNDIHKSHITFYELFLKLYQPKSTITHSRI